MHAQNGNLSAGTSFILGAITWFTHSDVETLLRILVAIGSIITAIMAARYYYYAIIEKKKILDGLTLKSKANARHIKTNIQDIEINTDRLDVLEHKKK